MKNSKISSHEIVDVLSAKASISKRAAEDFIKVLFALIEDELLAGESVKIKNLGTFKLQWNEPRKSVNVQTGQEIILSGYNKVVFNPDEKLKELVNQPFAHLEAVVIGADPITPISTQDAIQEEDGEDEDATIFDPLKVFSEQATEIKDLLSEINSINNTVSDEKDEIEVPIELPTQTVDEVEMVEVAIEVTSQMEPISDPVEDVVENLVEIVPEQEQQPEQEQHPAEQPEEIISDVVEQEVTQEQEPVKDDVPTKELEMVADPTDEVVQAPSMETVSPPPTATIVLPPVKRSKNKVLVLLAVLVGVVGLVAGVYFLVPSVKDLVDSKLHGDSEKVAEAVVPVKPQVEPVEVLADSSEADSSEVENEATVDSLQLLFDSERTYDTFIATERMKPGTRLAKIALHYYGCRDFWVYIYEANKLKFPNPDEIPVGAIVKVPKVDARLIDASNPRCMKKARELHDLYKKKR